MSSLTLILAGTIMSGVWVTKDGVQINNCMYWIFQLHTLSLKINAALSLI
jgi:hypothetical protein